MERSDRIEDLELEFREHGEQLKRRAQRILQELGAAEDAVAQAMVDKIEHPERPLEFLVDWAALSIRRDELRRREREATIGLDSEIHDVLHPADGPYRPSSAGQLHLTAPRALTIEGAEFHADFDRAVRALPELERDAFILTELRGLDQREAAAVLGVNQSTVSRRHQAAIVAIREEIT